MGEERGRREGDNRERGRRERGEERGGEERKKGREGEIRERREERGRLMVEFSIKAKTGFITFNKFCMVHD